MADQPEKDYTYVVAEEATAEKVNRTQEFNRRIQAHKGSKRKNNKVDGLRPIQNNGRKQYSQEYKLRGIKNLADAEGEE